MRRKARSEKGFSLVEMLIVVALVGVILALLVPDIVVALRKESKEKGQRYLWPPLASARASEPVPSSYSVEPRKVGLTKGGEIWAICDDATGNLLYVHVRDSYSGKVAGGIAVVPRLVEGNNCTAPLFVKYSKRPLCPFFFTLDER